MIKLFDEENIDNIDIIVPSNLELYYKEKYLDKNYNIYCFKNYVLNKYDGNKKIVNNNINYIIMYKALNEVSSKLSYYKNFVTYNFVHELIISYDYYFKYDLKDSDKIKDLKIIYDKYHELLDINNLINKRLILKEIDIINDVLFLDVDKFSDEELYIINRFKNSINIYVKPNISSNKLLAKQLSYFNINTNHLCETNKSAYYKNLNDIQEEVMFISNDISKRLINGYKYSDILIICNRCDYEPYFKQFLNHKYEKVNTKGNLTTRFITLFNKIISGDFSCSNFINLLKLDLFNVNNTLIDKLDNYVFSWDLEYNNFYDEFTYNPNGNKNSFSKKDENDLKDLNDLREDIISQFYYLLQNLKDCTKQDLLKNIWVFLEEQKVLDNLFEKDNDGYNSLLVAFDMLNDYFEKLNIIEVFNILNSINLTKKEKLSMQDEIEINSLDKANYYGKKIIYALGFNNKNYPSVYKFKGLINKYDVKEKDLLIKTEEHNMNENYLFSKLLNNEEVYLTNHKLGLDGKLTVESSLLKEISVINKEDDKLYDVNLIKRHYALDLSNQKVKKVDILDFKSINECNNHNLNKKISKDSALKLYTNNLYVSPSSIEAYSSCAFYHFCLYGLKIKVKEKYFFDNRELGTFIHYVLENVIKNDLNDITKDNVDTYIYKYSNNYLENNGKIQNNASKYIIKYLSKNVKHVINNIIKEADISKFKPKYFELEIEEDKKIKPIKIDLESGTLKIKGIIDRVDVYEDDNNYYYRIIDYKTGKKDLKLIDVVNGLNLQMLLYLLVLKEKLPTNKTIVPAGLLYYPALIKEESVSKTLSDDEKLSTLIKRCKMKGIVTKEALDIYGDDKDYVDYMNRTNINFERVFDIDSLELVFKCVKDTLKKIGDNLLSGDIKVNPKEESCKYCKYSSICSFDLLDKKEKTESLKNSEVIAMLEGDYND